MTDDSLDAIEALCNQIKRSLTNLGNAYKLSSVILNLCSKLEDKVIADKIRAKAVDIMSAGNPAIVEEAANAILDIIETKRAIIDGKDAFILPKTTQRSNKYIDDCKKYSDKNIADVETKIITYPYAKKLHEKITAGKWKGYLHARLTENIRIMYLWFPEERLLRYEAIITKNELEKG